MGDSNQGKIAGTLEMKFKLEGISKRNSSKSTMCYMSGGADRICSAKTLADLTVRKSLRKKAYQKKGRCERPAKPSPKPKPPPHAQVITQYMLDNADQFLTVKQISVGAMHCEEYVARVVKSLPVITDIKSWPRAFKLDSKEYFK